MHGAFVDRASRDIEIAIRRDQKPDRIRIDQLHVSEEVEAVALGPHREVRNQHIERAGLQHVECFAWRSRLDDFMTTQGASHCRADVWIVVTNQDRGHEITLPFLRAPWEAEYEARTVGTCLVIDPSTMCFGHVLAKQSVADVFGDLGS